MPESNVNEMPSKIIRIEHCRLGNDAQLLINDTSCIRRHLYIIKKTKHHSPPPYRIIMYT